jgi:hypothetical protein
MYQLTVSCWRYLSIVSFDDNGRYIRMDNIRNGWYWGLSYWQDRYFVSEKHCDPPGYYPVHVMDHEYKTLSLLNKRSQFGSNVHQIQCHNGKLYIICADKEKVLIYNLNDLREFPKIWRPENIQSGSYPNTLYFDDSYLYILCHNVSSDVSKVLQYYIYNLKFAGEFRLHHMKCHNIFAMQKKMWYCASEDHCLGTFDNSETIQIRDGQFVRGVARDDRFLFIGDSQTSTRSLRSLGDGRILVYDLSKKKIINQVFLSHCGQIHELRLINKKDLCHNNGEDREY